MLAATNTPLGGGEERRDKGIGWRTGIVQGRDIPGRYKTDGWEKDKRKQEEEKDGYYRCDDKNKLTGIWDCKGWIEGSARTLWL